MQPLPDRRGDVLWGALAAAFLVAQQVTGKATRDALFLSNHPATALPLVMMGSALLSVVVAIVVGRLLTTRTPRQVVPALVGLNAALLLASFVITQSAPRLASVLVYLQIAATGGTLLSGYWSVVNERFDPWTAKHVVNHLTLGASLGGVIGGVLAFAVAGTIPVATMLLLTAAIDVAAVVAIVRFAGDAPAVPAPPASANTLPFATLRSVPYLQLLALLVALGAVAAAVLDYVLKSRAAASLAPGPELMSFFAAYQTAMGLLALLGQTLLVRPTLQGLGLAGTVALRPLVVALAAIIGLVDLRLWSAALGRGCHDVLSNSLFRSGYELLYTPLPDAEKRATKQLVDVGFDKLGALLGGAATLTALRVLDTPERALLCLAVGLSIVAMSLTPRLHRGYVTTLAAALRAGKVRLELEDVTDSTTRLTMVEAHLTPARTPRPARVDTASDPLLRAIAELRSEDAERIRGVLARPEAMDPGVVSHLVPLLGRSDVYLDVLRALRKLAPQYAGQLLDTLLDSGADPVVRRRLPRILMAAPSPRGVEGLLRGIDEPLFEVRAASAVALAGIAARNPELHLPAATIFAAVRRELGAEPADTRPAPDGEARLEHVFRLLSLVLEREPLRIAERAVRGSDASLKGTALEYLENVLPRELRPDFLRFVGVAQAPRSRAPEAVYTDLMKSDSGGAARDRLKRRALRRRD